MSVAPDTFTPDEAAFFESRGEKEIPVEVSTESPAVTTDAPAAEEISGQIRDEKGKFVPHQALHAEREEHKKTKAQLEEFGRKFAVSEDRWNTLLQLNKQEEKPAVAPPDPETDIFGYMKHLGEKQAAFEAQTAAEKQQAEQQRQYQAQQNEIQTSWVNSAQAFAAKEPTFGDAAQFLSDSRMKQLEALGMIDPNMATEQGRLQQINAETFQIVQASRQAGKDPAEVIFEMAKKYGFAGQAAATTETIDPNAALGEKIDQLGKAISQSKTMTATAGKAAAEPNSAEALLNMSDAEFGVWLKTPANAKLFKQMQGG